MTTTSTLKVRKITPATTTTATTATTTATVPVTARRPEEATDSMILLNPTRRRQTTNSNNKLWRKRSLSETPSESRRTISKALDFLPWSKHKKSANPNSSHRSQTPVNYNQYDEQYKTVASHEADEKSDQKSDQMATLNYQRNIFRTSGSLIRDILNSNHDKSHKDKSSNSNSNSSNNNNASKHITPRKLKHFMQRNKSLDINELISNVEQQESLPEAGILSTNGIMNGLGAGGILGVRPATKSSLRKSGNVQRFLDDTYLEDLTRHESHQAFDELYGDHNQEQQQQQQQQQRHLKTQSNPHSNDSAAEADQNLNAKAKTDADNIHKTVAGNASRHILFNDENVVYLIKKELPVRREARESKVITTTTTTTSKTSGSVSKHHAQNNMAHQHHQHHANNYNENHNYHHHHQQNPYSHYMDDHENIVKARLKFKKLAPTETATLGRQQHQSHKQHRHHTQQLSKQSKWLAHSVNNLSDDCAYDDQSAPAEGTIVSANSRRVMLQRQNTSPALVSNSNTLSPDLSDRRYSKQQHPLQIEPQQSSRHLDWDRREPSDEVLPLQNSNEYLPDHQDKQFHQPFLADLQIPQQQTRQQQQVLKNSSSSSSMGSSSISGSGSVNISLNGTHASVVERPRAEKPRKKLSFREPVVADRDHDHVRMRRLSTPQQCTPVVSLLEDSVIDKPPRAITPPARVTMNHDHAWPNINNLLNPNISSLIGSHQRLHEFNNRFNFAQNPLLTASLTQQHQTHVLSTNCPSTESVKSNSDYHLIDGNEYKSQAMRIVRTVGQAFEVCHKFNIHKNSVDQNEERSDVSSELVETERISEQQQQVSDDDANKKDQSNVSRDTQDSVAPQRPNHLELVPQIDLNPRMNDDDKSPGSPSSPSREILKLKEELEKQAMQTRQALAQLMLVREQLISETNARIEAQARTQQLLQQNRELLEHLASLGAYSEQQAAGLTSANIAMAPQMPLHLLLQATSSNNNLATINQQINNLGSINQQLTSLSNQLSGLNQHSQNLQNFHNVNLALSQQNKNPMVAGTTTTTAAASSSPSSAGATTTTVSASQLQQTLNNALTANMSNLSQAQLNLNGNVANLNSSGGSGGSAAGKLNANNNTLFPSISQLQGISNQLQQINAQNNQQQHQQEALSNDLLLVNQDLLNRLQALNLGAAAMAAANANTTGSVPSSAGSLPTSSPQPQSSFFFVNPMSCTPSPSMAANTPNNSNNNNNNNNSNLGYNFLSGLGNNNNNGNSSTNLTPSPMSTLSRNSYTHSPVNDIDLRLSIDKNLNRIDEQNMAAAAAAAASLLIKPLGQQQQQHLQQQQLASLCSNGNISSSFDSRSTSTLDSQSSSHNRNINESTSTINTNSNSNSINNSNSNNNNSNSNTPIFNTVTLQITDESGNVTNQRKLSATPSFITRSTSEKVPSRSQMMTEVHRTAWARHTTK